MRSEKVAPKLWPVFSFLLWDLIGLGADRDPLDGVTGFHLQTVADRMEGLAAHGNLTGAVVECTRPPKFTLRM
jgi:hypothetical protein